MSELESPIDEQVLWDALMDNYSPEAIVAMHAILDAYVGQIPNAQVKGQLRYFRNMLEELIEASGENYNELLDQAGL